MQLFALCVLAMSGRGRQVNTTAKAIMYIHVSISRERRCEQQEEGSSEI